MRKSRFSNIGNYRKLPSKAKSHNSVFERIRSFFWNYPNKIFPFGERIIQNFKKSYSESQPLSSILTILLLLCVVVLSVYYFSTFRSDKKRVRLVEGVLGQPGDFNAAFIASYQVQKDVYQLVFDRLFKTMPDGTNQGVLVESWEYKEEGTELHLTMKSPIYWHDGEVLDANDVAFTVNLYKSLQGQDSYYDTVEDVEVEIISDSELVFKKERSTASFIETINWPILPEHILNNTNISDSDNLDFANQPIGSGPFMFEKWNENKISLIRNDNYWGKIPVLEEIIFKIYDSEVSLINAIEAGKIDSTTEITPLNLDNLENVPWIKLSNAALLRRYWAIYFNFNGLETLQNQQVRQAISSSIDRQRIIEEVLKGYGQESKGPIQENSWAYNEESKRYTYNLEEANTLFDDAGYSIPEGQVLLEKDGNVLEFELAYVSNPIQDEVARLIAEDLQKVGVKVNLNGLSYLEFRDTRLLSRNFDAILFGVEGLLDPDHFNLWHSTQSTAPGRNFSSYVSSYKVIEDLTRVDDALEKGKSSMDQENRKDLYLKFQNYLLEEVPAVFLYHPEFIYTYNKNLKGVDLTNVTLIEERFDTISDWYFD